MAQVTCQGQVVVDLFTNFYQLENIIVVEKLSIKWRTRRGFQTVDSDKLELKIILASVKIPPNLVHSSCRPCIRPQKQSRCNTRLSLFTPRSQHLYLPLSPKAPSLMRRIVAYPLATTREAGFGVGVSVDRATSFNPQ
jgi:hypothetical protein